MPNIKSAIKRVSVIEKKTLQNNMIKSEYKTAVRKFEAAVSEANKEKAFRHYAHRDLRGGRYAGVCVLSEVQP